MAKRDRERRRLEKRQEKQAKKLARKQAAADEKARDALPGNDPAEALEAAGLSE